MASEGKVRRTTILAKLGLAWDLNTDESLVSLITALSGRDGSVYIAHEYKDGALHDIDARERGPDLKGFSDYALEGALDEIVLS